jgi:hypothetical protein
LFDALQAAYPSKAITLLSEPQLKTLLNKYEKEHNKSAQLPRTTRARTTADAELGKKGGKRTRSDEVEDDGKDASAPPSSSSSSSSSKKGKKVDKSSQGEVEKPKKAKKAKKAKADEPKDVEVS